MLLYAIIDSLPVSLNDPWLRCILEKNTIKSTNYT